MGKDMNDFQIKRAQIDEWEYMSEQIREGRGRYAALDQETKEQTLKTVENIFRFLRNETAA